MSKRDYQVAQPLPLDEIQRVLAAARQAYPKLKEGFPQEVKFNAKYKSGWLPSLASVPALRPVSFLDVKAELDAGRMNAEVIADLLEGLLPLIPGGDPANAFVLGYAVHLPERAGCPNRSGAGEVFAEVKDQQLWLGFVTGGFSTAPNLTAQKKAALYKCEREYREEVIRRVIAAARLPLTVVPAGPSFTVQHTGGGELGNMFPPDEQGLAVFKCSLPGARPLDLARHVMNIPAVVGRTAPPAFSATLYVQAMYQPGDPAEVVYRHLEKHPWPVTSSELFTKWRLEDVSALAGLQTALHPSKKAVPLTLATFKLTGSAGAKLLVKTYADGHYLTLQLPEDQTAALTEVEATLGVTFRR